jgi:hypothetical protein
MIDHLHGSNDMRKYTYILTYTHTYILTQCREETRKNTYILTYTHTYILTQCYTGREEMRIAGETARIAKKWNVAWLRGTDWDALLAMEVPLPVCCL